MWAPRGWSQACSSGATAAAAGELVRVSKLSVVPDQDNVQYYCRARRRIHRVRAKVAVESESGWARSQASPLLLKDQSCADTATATATTSAAAKAPAVAKSKSSSSAPSSAVECLQFGGRRENADRFPPTKVVAKRRALVIAGPTAVGKTRLAIALAKQIGGDIISADSIQVYEGMDTGSAKTPFHEREGVPHHLLDIVAPTEEYSAAQFVKDARAATKLVLDNNRVPIVVGGTCTYLRRYMTSIARTAAAKPGTALPELERAAIEAEIWRLAASDPGGWEAAVQRLVQAGDPATAYSLTRHDWYRLHDALVETILVSGQPRAALGPKLYNYMLNESKYHHSWDLYDYELDFQCYFLYQHRAELYHWIDHRCEQMVAAYPKGLLQEASSLLDMGLVPDTSSASRGIGYQEAMEFLVEARKAGGACSEERFMAFLSTFQHVSRSLVKKQLTWFRSDQHDDVKQFHWIDASQPTELILEALRKEYWRRPGYPSELSGCEAQREATYREGKRLRHYKVNNRIFTNSAAIAPILKWLKETQGGR